MKENEEENKQWTKEEKQFIKEYWIEMSEGQSVKQKKILDQEEDTTKDRSGKWWTDEEDQYVKDNWQEMTDAEMGEELRRSKKSVQAERLKLGLKREEFNDLWTDEEEQFVKKNWKEMSDSEMGDELGRSRMAVRIKRGKSEKMDLSRMWSDEEEQYVKDHYEEMSDAEMAGEIWRGEKAIKSKRNKMGLKKQDEDPWTEEEEEFVEENWEEMTDAEIGENLKRSKSAVKHKRLRLGLKMLDQWTDEEEKHLRDRWHEKSDEMDVGEFDEEIANELGRNKNSVHKKRLMMGLRSWVRNLWTEEEKGFIRENYESMTDAEMADELGRSPGAVQNKRLKNNLLRENHYDEELGHIVRSSWEAKIGRMLKEAGHDYEYEVPFELSNKKVYHPDFLVDHITIDPHSGRFKKFKKFSRFHEEYDEYTFIILSPKDYSDVCDIYIPWEDREKLIDVLYELLND